MSSKKSNSYKHLPAYFEKKLNGNNKERRKIDASIDWANWRTLNRLVQNPSKETMIDFLYWIAERLEGVAMLPQMGERDRAILVNIINHKLPADEKGLIVYCEVIRYNLHEGQLLPLIYPNQESGWVITEFLESLSK